MDLKTFLFKISDDTKTFCLSCTAPNADAALHVMLQTLQYDGELVAVYDEKTARVKEDPNPPQWVITYRRKNGDDEGSGSEAPKSEPMAETL